MEHLFLYSILRDCSLSQELIDKILWHYKIKGEKYEQLLDEMDQLVFHKGQVTEDNTVHSIFQIISQEVDSNCHFPNRPLTINDIDGFPINNMEEAENIMYIDKLEDAVEKLFSFKQRIKDFSTNLFFLQKFYLSSLAQGGDPSTVSKFEYLKSRAAFAQCKSNQSIEEDLPFLLLCGDISGIQEFIYDIHSAKAYRSIKGRSFYLQLVVEAIILNILEETQIPICNIIYSSGGKFFILLPNNKEIIGILKKLKSQIEESLFEEFQMGLYVCMDWETFNIEKESHAVQINSNTKVDKPINDICELWKFLSEKTSAQKAKKYHTTLTNNKYFKQLFCGELEEDFNRESTEICAVLGIPVKREKENILNEIDVKKGENPIYVHTKVIEQANLGQTLQNANFINISLEKIASNNWVSPLDLNVFFCLQEKPVTNAFSMLLNPLSEEEYLAMFSKYGTAGFMFYGGNKQAILNGQLKTLDDLAKPDKDKSMSKIGVIKMDIDNLGDIFKGRKFPMGKRHVYSTFASMSDLSARIDWFFSGYLNKLRNNDEYNDSVNIIYAGGDDLCAIGRWDKILRFAASVRKDFARYVGTPNGVTISAGYVMFNPKYPISKAISLAGEALEEAKLYKKTPNAKEEKNAIHLFNTTLSWGEEWDFTIKLKELFILWLNNDVMSKGVIYKLFVFKYSKDKGGHEWRWHSAYYFAKMNKPELKVFVKAFISGHFDSPTLQGKFSADKMFEIITLAAKLADYEMR